MSYITLFLFGFFSITSFNVNAKVVASTKIKRDGLTVLEYNDKENKITIEIKTHQYRSSNKEKDNPLVCTGSVEPCILTDSLKIRKGSKYLNVPVSTFLDLSDISTIGLIKRKKIIFLEITGGDASESYISNIYFDDKGVLKRTLSSSIVPNEPSELTIYFYGAIGE